MRALAAWTIAALTALIAAEPVATRQFRAGTALVMVDVVATRADGNLNRDLTRFVDEQVRAGDYVGVMRTGANPPLNREFPGRRSRAMSN